jgi:DNA invertase Pin-like site-specific DNA recombinase
MRTVAYIRISTGSQDLDSQRLAILDYAHRQGLMVHTFVEAKVSSRRVTARQELDTLGRLQSGGLILVSELSRLGRSVGQDHPVGGPSHQATCAARSHQGEH